MTVPVRKKASDFDQRILEIFDGYVHGKMTKREFTAQVGKYAAAGITGAMMPPGGAPARAEHAAAVSAATGVVRTH